MDKVIAHFLSRQFMGTNYLIFLIEPIFGLIRNYIFLQFYNFFDFLTDA